MIEKEFKILITKKKYEELNDAFNWDESVEQENFYYVDAKRVLKKKKINVRVRKDEKKILLQIKSSVNSEGNLHISNEMEEEIKEVPFKINSDFLEKRIGTNVGELYLIGFLKTYRKECHWDKFTIICLDESSYLGTVDYELEIEFTNQELNSELLNKLKGHGIFLNKSSYGKKSRFMRKIESII
ncbi:MAG: CYTH domain-containing protein [Candidatus Improbicoccus pseudotrichonymphae]|uniref:CYTH domain-containing protein n=1 Tax=Candidatus Improbicoccus pseudotrichonymphae TaxID=3033792 RepID=A0AA48KWZ0_9FIRM|nr:MAG: CYTH domain-containing protein [Candidatus Improbicoccus pseudotrichonymphae]